MYNVPSDSSDGTKVPIRTLGKPGEDYGHPYKTRVDQRRNAELGPIVPTSATRQHEQKAKAEKYYDIYYRKHKSTIKNESKKDIVEKNVLHENVKEGRCIKIQNITINSRGCPIWIP